MDVLLLTVELALDSPINKVLEAWLRVRLCLLYNRGGHACWCLGRGVASRDACYSSISVLLTSAAFPAIAFRPVSDELCIEDQWSWQASSPYYHSR